MHFEFRNLLPQHLLSRLLGFFANLPMSSLKNGVIRYYIKHFAVDMQEALESDYRKYPTFNAFFTRQLKANARPIATDPNAIIAPVDGAINQLGKIHGHTLIQAKNRDYDLSDLLAGDASLTQVFNNGKFLTGYLSPKDYHRVHMPVNGQLETMIYVPGRLFSVDQKSVASTPKLFTRNERVICIFNSKEYGKFAVILIGAMIVGSVVTRWQGVVMPHKPRTITHWQFKDKEIILKKGEELGYFQLGSSVILLFQPEIMDWLPALKANDPLKMGQIIGHKAILSKNRY